MNRAYAAIITFARCARRQDRFLVAPHPPCHGSALYIPPARYTPPGFPGFSVACEDFSIDHFFDGVPSKAMILIFALF